MARKVLCFLLLGVVVISPLGVVAWANGHHFRDLGFVKFEEEIAAPDFRLTDLEGRQVSLKGYQGKLVLLLFWVSW